MSVGVRLVLAASVRHVGIDEALMHGYGLSWLRTGSYEGIQWPVPWPLASSALGVLVGGRTAVVTIFALGATAALLPLHLGLRELADEAAARWGVLLVALLPACGVVILKSGSHSLYLPTLALAFLLHVRSISRPTARRLIALGATLGLAYVTRTDGLVYLVAVAASFLLWDEQPGGRPAPTSGEAGARRAPSTGAGLGARARRAALVSAGGLLLVIPNVLHLHHHLGRWTLSAHVGPMMEQPFYLTAEEGDTLAEGRRAFQETEGGIVTKAMANPGYVARKVAYNLRLFLGELGDIYVFPAVLWMLLGLGLPGLVARGGRAGWMLLLWTAPTLAFLPLNVEARYFSPMAMFLAAFSGIGIARAAGWASTRPRLLAARAGGGVLLAFLLGLSAMQVAAARSREDASLDARAGAVIRRLGQRLPEAFVFRPDVRFLIDGRPFGERTVPLGREAEARLFVVDRRDPHQDDVKRLTRAIDTGSLEVVSDRDDIVIYERHP